MKKKKKAIGILIPIVLATSSLAVYEHKLRSDRYSIAVYNKDNLADKFVHTMAQDIYIKGEQIRLEIERKEKIRKELLRKQNVNYDNSNVSKVSNITYEEMKFVLKDTTMKNLYKAFVDAEREFKVNAFFLAGIVALESSWNTSDRAINSNNLTGMGVYSDSSKGYYYESKYDCVIDTASQLRKNYLTKGGEYFNGLASQDVNKKYCTKDNWHLKVDSISNKLVKKYKENYL